MTTQELGLWCARIKDALAGVEEVEETLPLPERFSVSDLVDTGQRLWLITKKVTPILERIKVRLREEAAPSSGTSYFDSDFGRSCMVVPQPPTLTTHKETDIEGLKTMLGDAFPEFFEEVVTYRPREGFNKKTLALPLDQQSALFEGVTLNNRTPRVVFKES